MDKFHGIIGSPELEAQAGTDFQITHRYIQFEDQQGFGSLDLAQLDGTLLALDWVVA